MSAVNRDSSQAVRTGASATRRSARMSQASELTHPRVAFALADLLDEIAQAFDAGRLDHVVYKSALRAARAINDVTSHQYGMTRAMRCNCKRVIRTSASLFDEAPPIKCLECDTSFEIIHDEDFTAGVFEKSRRARAPEVRGSLERSP